MKCNKCAGIMLFIHYFNFLHYLATFIICIGDSKANLGDTYVDGCDAITQF